MSYIGRQNLGGAYRQLDDISSGFDGSDTTHTMQVNSQNVTVGDVNQIILSLGGVIQKPGTDFTVSGSVLTFTTAPAANTSFFAILLGSDNGGTVTPTDGSVTTDKFASGVAIGATGTANTLAGIPFYRADDSIYTHDVSGTDSTAQYNTAYGVNALDAITTSDYNVAIGYEAGSSLTTHNSDVLIGYQAGKALSTGDDGVIAIGYQAGLSLTTCSSSVFIGKNAGDGHDTEDHNMGIGRNALTGSINGGEYNVAIGNYAGAALTTADYCTAVGYQAGTSITTGGYNTLIGYSSGDAITDADTNTAVGYDALTANVHGDRNTAVGYGVLRTHTVSSKSDVGNTCMGYLAGSEVTTGDGNTLIGHLAYATGSGDLTTGSSNVAIGMDLKINSNSHSNSITIGSGIEGFGDRFAFGKAGNVVENTFTSNANFAQSSDQRLKTSITDNDLGLDFIDELKTKTYKWKASNDLDKDDPQLVKRYNEENQMDTDVLMYGMLAQDVKVLLDKYGHEKFTGWSEDAYGVQNLSREMFIIPLIKAVQELSAKVKALEEA